MRNHQDNKSGWKLGKGSAGSMINFTAEIDPVEDAGLPRTLRYKVAGMSEGRRRNREDCRYFRRCFQFATTNTDTHVYIIPLSAPLAAGIQVMGK